MHMSIVQFRRYMMFFCVSGSPSSVLPCRMREGMKLLQDLQKAQSKLDKLIPLARAYSEPQVDVKGLEPLASKAGSKASKAKAKAKSAGSNKPPVLDEVKKVTADNDAGGVPGFLDLPRQGSETAVFPTVSLLGFKFRCRLVRSEGVLLALYVTKILRWAADDFSGTLTAGHLARGIIWHSLCIIRPGL